MDYACQQITESTSILNSILDGSSDCPKLFIAMPVPKGTSLLGDVGCITNWTNAIQQLFHDPQLLLSDSMSVRLYPLCAYSLEPVGSGYEVLHAHKTLSSISFALRMSTVALSSVLIASCVPLITTSLTVGSLSVTGMSMQTAHALTMYVAAMDSITATFVPTETRLNGKNINDLEALRKELNEGQEMVLNTLTQAMKEGKNAKEVFSQMDPKVLRQIKPVAAGAFGHIRSILNASDPGLLKLKCLMSPCVSKSGDMQWVKHEHVSAWRGDHIHSLVPCTSMKSNSLSNISSLQLHIDSNHSAEEQPSQTITGNTGHSHSHSHSNAGDDHSCNCEVETYDPWVLIAHPSVSSSDCKDVEAMSDWLHTHAGILRSKSDALATALISDNCPHVARLQHRLYHNPHYLKGFGLMDEDEDDVIQAVNIQLRGNQHNRCVVS